MSWFKDLDKESLIRLFTLIKNKTGKNSIFIEKDYVQSLILNELTKYSDKFVFKGGTSLSRVHHVVNRFSEDLDISLFVDPSEGERRSATNYIKDIADKLGLAFDKRIENVRSKRMVNRFFFTYDSIFNQDLKQEVLVELSFIMKVYPIEQKELGGIIYDFLNTKEGKQYNDLIIPAPTMVVQSLERTLVDKVFAICDYYLDKNTERQSRHLFDICKILPRVDFKSPEFNKLVNEVRFERLENFNKSNGTHCKSAPFNFSIPEIINNLIKDRFFENDYKAKTTVLLYDNTPYDEIINNGIKKIADWGFPRSPLPEKEIQADITQSGEAL